MANKKLKTLVEVQFDQDFPEKNPRYKKGEKAFMNKAVAEKLTKANVKVKVSKYKREEAVQREVKKEKEASK